MSVETTQDYDVISLMRESAPVLSQRSQLEEEGEGRRF
jgi:hypothetical protein